MRDLLETRILSGIERGVSVIDPQLRTQHSPEGT